MSRAELDRRQFLALTSALGGAALLGAGGCRSRSGTPHRTGWDVLRLAREAVRASPDHLVNRAEEAVATRDPKRIAAFVREHVAAYPPADDRLAPDTASLWGPRATLRGGAGSLRDRADLLAELLTRAGFTAAVVAITRPASLSAEALFSPREAAFSPDRSKLAPLLAAGGHGAPLADAPDLQTAQVVKDLADTLLAAVPAALRTASKLAPSLPDRIPIVEYERDGKKGWAIAYGDVDVTDAQPAGYLGRSGDVAKPSVKVTLSVALNPPPGSVLDRTVVHDVATGTWTADQVAGAQLVLGFVPPGTVEANLGQDLRAIPQRIAMMRLMGVGVVTDATTQVRGSLLGLAGTVASPAKPDAPAGSQAPLVQLPDADRKQRVGAVAAVAVVANAAAFPDVEVSVSLADATGAPVNGLIASDLRLSEGGTELPFALTANVVPAGTRVLVMYDASGSIAQSWRTPAARAEFEAAFSDTLVAAHRQTPFLIQVIGLGAQPSPDRWLAPDAASLRATFAAITSTSDVWSTLGRSLPAAGASAAIMISDNASSLEPPEQIPGLQRALAASGVPVAIVPVGTVDRAATDRIKALAPGPELAKADPDLVAKLGDFVLQQVRKAAATSYRLRYRAPDQGDATRVVEVAVAGRPTIKGQASYRVPPEADRAAPSGVAGVYMTIELAGRSVWRRLGGVDVSARGVVSDTASRAAIEDALAAIDGLHAIAFEPARPTTAAILDDALTAALSLEPMFAAAQTDQLAALIEATKTLRRFDSLIGILLDPVPDDPAPGSGATPDGLRVIVTRDVLTKDGVARDVDVVPQLNGWVGLAPDPQQRFAAAMRHSLPINVRESQRFASSAAKQLAGVALVALAPLASVDSIPGWTDARRQALRPMLDRYDSMIRLVPADGAIAAMWAIDPATGTTVAVTADGRGGGHCTDDGTAKTNLIIALVMLTAACVAENPAEMSALWQFCVGADVYGVGATVVESFNHPVHSVADVLPNLTSSNLLAPSLYATAMLAGLMGGPQNGMARALIGVIVAMLGLIAEFCH